MVDVQPQAQPAPQPKRITEEEFMALPDDGRKYELVDGEVTEVPTGLMHEDIGMNLSALLLAAGVRTYGRLYGSSAGYRMANGNIRSPDVSFMRTERLPEGTSPESFGEGAPDLAVEIVSPSERPIDIFRKLAEYFESGAQQVWLIRPETRTVTLYGVAPDPVVLGTEGEFTGGDLLPDFRCRVADLFATA